MYKVQMTFGKMFKIEKVKVRNDIGVNCSKAKIIFCEMSKGRQNIQRWKRQKNE